MALKLFIADGSEYPCHKCGQSFKPGSIKVKRPSRKPGLPGVETVGGKAFVFVHEKCDPRRTGSHAWTKVK